MTTTLRCDYGHSNWSISKWVLNFWETGMMHRAAFCIKIVQPTLAWHGMVRIEQGVGQPSDLTCIIMKINITDFNVFFCLCLKCIAMVRLDGQPDY